MNSRTRFSDRAQAYSRHRPEYPPQAFDVLFESIGDPATLCVADIGAGTGISTAALAERVAHVHAVEPNVQMRARAALLSNVTWHAGTAERTGLPDRSVDVAAAFQAFHWFEPQAAFSEFSRIASRRIALLQYEREESDAFSNAYGLIVRTYAVDHTEDLRLRALQNFARLAGPGLYRVELPFTQTLSREGVLGRLASSSYLPQSGEAADAMRVQANKLFEAFEQSGAVTMAMTLHVLTADLKHAY